MAINKEQAAKYEPVCVQDILAVTTGTAPWQTTRRVFGEAVTDNALRNRVALSLPPDDEDAEIADAVATAPAAVSQGLEKRLRAMTRTFVRMDTPSSDAPPFLDRVLTVLDTLLTLPCLAPAIAAPDAAGIAVQTQTVETVEGVRVVFQQLPVAAGHAATVRVIVDATVLAEPNRFVSATVGIAEGDQQTPFVVPLAAPGRGLLDVPNPVAAKLARRLVSVTLQER